MPRVAGDDAAGAPCGPVHEASRTRTARPESRTQNLGPCWARRAAPASRRDSLRRNAGELRAAVSAAGVLSEPCCPTMPYMIYCLIPCRMRRRLGFSRGLAFHVWGWARPAAARLGARHYPWPTHAHLSRASRCESFLYNQSTLPAFLAGRIITHPVHRPLHQILLLDAHTQSTTVAKRSRRRHGQGAGGPG